MYSASLWSSLHVYSTLISPNASTLWIFFEALVLKRERRETNIKGMEESSSTTVSSYWGIAASLAAGIINAIGYSVQKRALTATPERYCCNSLWWKGFALLLIAEACGGIAFGLLAGSIVAALGSIAVVLNAFLAIRYQGERFSGRVIWGSLAITAGAVILGVITPPTKEVETAYALETRLLSSSSAVYHAIVGGICIFLHAEVYPTSSGDVPIVLIGLATYAAAVSSLTAVWFRATVTLLFQASSTFDHWLLYTSILVTAVTGIWAAGALEPRGLCRFPQSRWIPLHFVSCLFWFGIAGVVIYGDDAFVVREQVWFAMALVLIIVGVSLIEW